MTLVGFVVDWTWIWWLFKLPITDEAKDWEEEAFPEPPEPPDLPLDSILWMIGEGEKDEVEESDKVILRELCWVDNTTFLPISSIGLISGVKPLHLLETQESTDMKVRPKLKEQESYCWFLGCLRLASQRSWELISRSISAHQWLSSTRVLAVSKMVLNKFKAMLVWSWRPGSILDCLATRTVIKK